MKKQFLIIMVLLCSTIPIGGGDISRTLLSGDLKAVVHPDDSMILSKWNVDILTVSPIKAEYIYDIYTVSGGVEYMVILAAKPDSNIISIRVEGEGLTWYYQPPMGMIHKEPGWLVNDTHVYDDKGILRFSYDSLNIVGSYAVYYLKQGGVYGTGKAFHVYRPLVTDSKGSTVWGELKYNSGVLSVIIPQDWLDNAVYPVYVDPTFGHTGIGASNVDYNQDTIRCSNGTIGVLDGVLNTVHFYGQTLGAGGQIYGGVYRDGDLKLIEGEGVGVNLAGGALQWWNISLSGIVSVNASSNYWASVWIDTLGNTIRVKADWQGAGAKNSRYDITPWVGLPWEDPLTPNAYHGYHYSIYCTYTEGAGPVSYSLTALTRYLQYGLNGSLVDIRDPSNTLVYSGITNATGYTTPITVNVTGVYSVSAGCVGFQNNTVAYNVTGDSLITVQLTPTGGGGGGSGFLPFLMGGGLGVAIMGAERKRKG